MRLIPSMAALSIVLAAAIALPINLADAAERGGKGGRSAPVHVRKPVVRAGTGGHALKEGIAPRLAEARPWQPHVSQVTCTGPLRLAREVAQNTDQTMLEALRDLRGSASPAAGGDLRNCNFTSR
jgi:hypothetical protein